MHNHGQVDQAAKAGVVYAYDPLFRGPKSERTRTDTTCLIIFCVVTAVWMSMGIWAIASCDVSKFAFAGQIVIHGVPMQGTLGPVFVGLLLSLIATMTLVFAMRWISTFILSVLIFLLVALLAFVAISMFLTYSRLTRLFFYEYAGYYLAGGIIATIVLVVTLLLLIILRKRIKFALALIKESSRAVSSMWSTVFFPIVPAVLQAAVLTFGGSVALTLLFLGHIHSTTILDIFHIFNIVACAWAMLFISALTQMSLSGAFATWYWTFNKDTVPYFVMTISVTRSIVYHSGTAAFGALLVTICRILRSVVSARHGGVCCTLCIKCLMSSLEDFVQRFNQNAYIMCAVHGKGLCSSALSAYQLILRNILRVMAADLITGILFAFCKLFIAIATGILGTMYLNTHYCLFPIFGSIVFYVGGYFIASAFFSVYATAVDTLVLCALEDAERNDGSAQRPYFMSHRLRKILVKDAPNITYQPTQPTNYITAQPGQPANYTPQQGQPINYTNQPGQPIDYTNQQGHPVIYTNQPGQPIDYNHQQGYPHNYTPQQGHPINYADQPGQQTNYSTKM